LEETPNIKILYEDYYYPWPLFIIAGVMAGIIYEFVEQRAQRKSFLQKYPYWVTLLIKPIIYGVLIQIAVILLGVIFSFRFHNIVRWSELLPAVTGKIFWVFFIFFLINSLIISFIQLINQYFGSKVMLNMIIGKYFRPFEEYRIFMFLDMRDSTTIAEQLGTIQYSRFIQDSFRDFTKVILKYQPEVYQYVGDEVVLTWLPESGLTNFNCLHACFYFNEILQAKSDYYTNEYGIVPSFKAGAHIGRVRVAEIGIVRRDIAYHGDVMNTTARIQSQCNTLGHNLLISEVLWKELPKKIEQFQFHRIDQIVLKGKELPVNLIGVVPTADL
jgi:adenylate cyclase